MRLIKVDNDIYNLDFLVKATVDEIEAELTFSDAQKLTVPIEFWNDLIRNEKVSEYKPDDEKSSGIFV